MEHNKIKVALIQNNLFPTKEETLTNLSKLLTETVALHQVQYLFLGECFNSLYKKDILLANSEDFLLSTSPTITFLQAHSLSLKAFIFGTIPEYDPLTKGHYNTAVAFSPTGELIAKHRKIHLFDVDIPGKITCRESETFTPGSEITVFEAGKAKIGMGICYDIRFPELALIMNKKGANLLYYPSAFNQTTGPLHWELLLRSRALDQQVFLVGVSPARYFIDQGTYQAWGHSTIVDPMGRVLKTCEQGEEVLIQEIDLGYVEEVREQLPYQRQKRYDVYKVEEI